LESGSKNTIVIIGAGPAGIITSLYLSKAKVSHLLIDKAKFPREKVCGESFAGNVFKVLDELDPSIKTDMYANGIVKHANEFGFYIDSRKRYGFKIPEKKSQKIQASRFEFDEFLVRRASKSFYCTLIESVSVLETIKKENGIELSLSNKTKVFARMVVFSNGGVSGLVKRFRGEEFDIKGTQFLFAKGSFKNVNVLNPNSAIDFHISKAPFKNSGYLTLLPNGNMTLGAIVEAKTLKENNEISLKETISKSIEHQQYLNEVLGKAKLVSEIKTTSLRLGNFKKKFAGDNYVIAGDAAVPLNPITGMGVMMAMYFGKHSARIIIEAVKKDDFSYATLKEYDQYCQKKFRFEFRKSNLYTYLQVNHYNFFIWLIKRLDKNKFLSDLI
jgi:flavin-dependent dehydrogenase